MLGYFPFSYKALPLVYDESLSYWEQVVYLTEEIQNTQKALERFVKEITVYFNDIENSYQGYTDKKIREVYKNIDSLVKSINGAIKSLTELLENTENELNNKIDDNERKNQQDLNILDQKIQVQINEVFSFLFTIQANLLSDFQKLKNSLEKEIYKMASNQTGNTIIVNNPVTKRLSSLNKALNSIYNFIRSFTCLTVKEYRDLKITKKEYEKRKITFLEYNSRSYLIFLNDIIYKKYKEDYEIIDKKINDIVFQMGKQNKVLNTITGSITTPKTYWNSIADRTFLGVTKEQYSKMTEINKFSKYNSLNIKVNQYRKEMMARYIYEIMEIKKLSSGKWKINFSYGFDYIIMTMELESSVLDKMDIDISFINNIGLCVIDWNHWIYDIDENIVDVWYKKIINNSIKGSMNRPEGTTATIIINIYFRKEGIKYECNIENTKL